MKILGEIFLMIIIQVVFVLLAVVIGRAIGFPHLMFAAGWLASALYYHLIKEDAHS
jgi:hypothetical protein